MSCTSFETAPTKSASRSSLGELLTCPDVPTSVVDCVSLPSREKRFVPLTQLSSSTTTKPPRPSGIIPPPNPERPRISSMSLRSPVHLMLASGARKGPTVTRLKFQVASQSQVAKSQGSRKLVTSESGSRPRDLLVTALRRLSCDL